MNRYKLKKKDFPAAISFIRGKTKKEDAPTWAVKFKNDLSVSGKEIKFKGLPIISQSEVDSFLRKTLFDKTSDVPFGRDSAHHLLKSRVVGVSKRNIMEFFRKQKTLNSRSALPKPKKFGGKKLKKYTIETDLIFVKNTDVIKANKRFAGKIHPLTYIVSTVEKTTGLSHYDYVLSKKAHVVTPLVINHIRSIAKKLKVDPKTEMSLRMDRGKEFGIEALKKIIPDTEYVGMGPSCENRNKMCQRNFYRLLRNRRAITIREALRQTETLINQSYNRIQRATPNECVDKTKKEILTQYNKTRNTYEQGDKRSEFQVDDYVRIQTKKAKAGIAYKTYKNQTFTERVFKISKRTKGKRRDQPIKYRVNGTWYTIDKLLRAAPWDPESEKIVDDRDKQQAVEDKRARERYDALEKEKSDLMEVVKQAEIKEGVRRKTRAVAQEKHKAKLKEKREEEEALDKFLEDEEIDDEKKPKKKRAVTIKHKGETVLSTKRKKRAVTIKHKGETVLSTKRKPRPVKIKRKGEIIKTTRPARRKLRLKKPSSSL